MQDILWNLPFKRLLELRSTREQALIAEKEESERIRQEQEKAMQRERARNMILGAQG